MARQMIGWGVLAAALGLSGCVMVPLKPAPVPSALAVCMRDATVEVNMADCLRMYPGDPNVAVLSRDDIRREKEASQASTEAGWRDYDRWAAAHPREARAAHVRQLIRQGPPGGYRGPYRSCCTPRYSRGYGYGYPIRSRPAYGYGH